MICHALRQPWGARSKVRSIRQLLPEDVKLAASAADRTMLEAERTEAAWVRYGLAAPASGIGARALLDKLVPT